MDIWYLFPAHEGEEESEKLSMFAGKKYFKEQLKETDIPLSKAEAKTTVKGHIIC